MSYQSAYLTIGSAKIEGLPIRNMGSYQIAYDLNFIVVVAIKGVCRFSLINHSCDSIMNVFIILAALLAAGRNINIAPIDSVNNSYKF